MGSKSSSFAEDLDSHANIADSSPSQREQGQLLPSIPSPLPKSPPRENPNTSNLAGEEEGEAMANFPVNPNPFLISDFHVEHG